MQEHIEFDPSYTLLTLACSPGEAVNVEPGAMVSMAGMQMQTKSSGGFLKGLKKMALGGESFFLNTFTAGAQGGWISLAPGAPGDIKHRDIQPGRQVFIQGGSYLASTIHGTDSVWDSRACSLANLLSLFVHLQKMGNLGVLGSIPSEQSKKFQFNLVKSLQ